MTRESNSTAAALVRGCSWAPKSSSLEVNPAHVPVVLLFVRQSTAYVKTRGRSCCRESSLDTGV